MIMLVAAGDHFRLGWTAATCLNALASLREWATRSHRAYWHFTTVMICNFLLESPPTDGRWRGRRRAGEV